MKSFIMCLSSLPFHLMAVAAACLALTACSDKGTPGAAVTDATRAGADNVAPFRNYSQHSMKGWELYYFLSENKWTFSLLQGTNRNKDYKEVVFNPYKVTEVSDLVKFLAQMPQDEDILFIYYGNLDSVQRVNEPVNIPSPPDHIMAEIRKICAERKLNFHEFK